MAIRRTELDAVVKRDLPYPIAEIWHRFIAADRPHQRADLSVATINVVLRTLIAFLLPDYVRGPRDRKVDELLPMLDKPSLGALWEITRETTRSISKRKLPAFIPELASTLFDEKGKPTEAHRTLEKLINTRNYASPFSHGVPSISDTKTAALANELEDAVRLVLESLLWLASYRPLRIISANPNHAKLVEARAILLIGSHELEKMDSVSFISHAGGLVPGTVYLSDAAGTALLKIEPFLSVQVDPTAKRDRCVLFLIAPGLDRIHLRHEEADFQVARRIPALEGELSLAAWWEKIRPELRVELGILDSGLARRSGVSQPISPPAVEQKVLPRKRGRIGVTRALIFAAAAASAVAVAVWRGWPAGEATLDLADLPDRPAILIAPFRHESTRIADKKLWPLLDRTLFNALWGDEYVYGRLQRVDPAEVSQAAGHRGLKEVLAEEEVAELAAAETTRAELVLQCHIARIHSLIDVRCRLWRPDRRGFAELHAARPTTIEAVEGVAELLRAQFPARGPGQGALDELLLERASAADVLVERSLSQSSERRIAALDQAISAAPNSLGLHWVRFLERPRDEAHLDRLAAAASTHADAELRAFFDDLAGDTPACDVKKIETLAARYRLLSGGLAEAACRQRRGETRDAVEKALEISRVPALRSFAAVFVAQELHYLEADVKREIEIRTWLLRLMPEDADAWARLATAHAEAEDDALAGEAIGVAQSMLTGDKLAARRVGLHGLSVHLAASNFDEAFKSLELADQNTPPEARDRYYWLARSLYWHMRGELGRAYDETREGMNDVVERAWAEYPVLATHAFYLSFEAEQWDRARAMLGEFRSQAATRNAVLGDTYGLELAELVLDLRTGKSSPEQYAKRAEELGRKIVAQYGQAGEYERALHECLAASHLDHKETARRLLEKNSRNKFIGACRFRHAQLLVAEGDFAGAESELQIAFREVLRARLGAYGFIAPVLLALGRAREELGRKDEAKATYERLLRHYGRSQPSIPEAAEAKKRLGLLR